MQYGITNNFVDVDLNDGPDNKEGEKKPRLKRRTMILSSLKLQIPGIIIFLLMVGIIGYVGIDHLKTKLKEAGKHKPGFNSTVGNASNMTVPQVQPAKVILPLWDDEPQNEIKVEIGDAEPIDEIDQTEEEDEEDDDPSTIFPNKKFECSMRSKHYQCYLGHRCYKKKCVSWCRNNYDCLTGHTCLRKERGTNWRLCSLSPDEQIPCTENWKYCKEDGDCCTGSCQLRGKYMVCVPPKEFEQWRPKPKRPNGL